MPDRIVVTPVALCQNENAVVSTLRQQGYEVITHGGLTPPSVDDLRGYLRDAVGMVAGMEPRVVPRHTVLTVGRDAGHDLVGVLHALERAGIELERVTT